MSETNSLSYSIEGTNMVSPKENSRIVYITAGAGGMYCGSCIRDNLLTGGLEDLGWDVTLLPLYTPIRVDEADHSVDQIFFGGINVYLQQKIPLFRHLPSFLDRWLDNPKLIRRVASRAVSVSAKELGSMTLSMVKGEHGYQKKEVARLVHWLKELAKPDLICLTNLLVGGSIPALKRELGVPIFVTLQGDDVFLDELEEPWREQVLAEMKKLASEADGFITFSEFYRDHMCGVLDIPKEKFRIVPLGVDVEEFNTVHAAQKDRKGNSRIGYFARLSPEKGFDIAVDSFLELAKRNNDAELHVAGWLSEKDRKFYEEQIQKIEEAGLSGRFQHVEAPDLAGKLKFLSEIDIFSVPARFIEPKGIYVLEAMACGLPVGAPDRGAFPEMINASGAGALSRHGDPVDLADKLHDMIENPDRCREMGAAGRKWVEESNNQRLMAEATGSVFASVLSGSEPG